MVPCGDGKEAAAILAVEAAFTIKGFAFSS
jgi:hypothetical protein